MSRKGHIFTAVDKAYSGARIMEGEISSLKWVVFSDHHRGVRDGADDFLACEQTYIKALRYYYQNGYGLLLLGDVEEFWENTFKTVLSSYNKVMELEKKFYDDHRLFRIWGNHDDNWRFQGAVSKHLGWLFPNLKAYESLRIKISQQGQYLGELFLIHGHQGTLASERWAVVSKFFVRYFWRTYQRVFKKALSTPSKSIKLRSEHDHAMYHWASQQKGIILICGHTHQPVFMSLTHADIISYQIEKLSLRQATEPQTDLRGEMAQLEAKLQEIQKQKKGTHLSTDPQQTKPCYFNSGCCSFSDGDITGLEIDNGKIRLVKWLSGQSSDYQVLESAQLEHVLKKCR